MDVTLFIAAGLCGWIATMIGLNQSRLFSGLYRVLLWLHDATSPKRGNRQRSRLQPMWRKIHWLYGMTVRGLRPLIVEARGPTNHSERVKHMWRTRRQNMAAIFATMAFILAAIAQFAV